MPERIEKVAVIVPLLDAYGELLSVKQLQALSLLYEEDLSLAEIAAAMHGSRQAAHDLIRRGEAVLHGFEAKLHLLEQLAQRETALAELNALLQEAGLPEESLRQAKSIMARLLPDE